MANKVVVDTEINVVDAKKEIKSLESDLKKLEAEKKKTDETFATYKEMGVAPHQSEINKYDELIAKIKEAKNRIAELQASITASKSAGTGAEDKAQQIEKIKTASDRASKSIRKMGDSAKKSKAGFNIGLKSILKYAFGIRSLFVLVNKLRSALVDGFKNLAQFNNGVNPTNTALSNLKSALTQLKNSFAVAFAPILTVVEPILTRLISLLSTAMNYVGQFFAALTGASTYIKATKVQENYAKSLNGTASAAKKASNNLSGLDELNIIQKEDGGGGAVMPKDMFEKSPISKKTAKIADKIRNDFDRIAKKAIDLSNIFKKGFFEGLGDPTERLQSIKNSIEKIKKSLKGIFDAEFQRGFNRFINTAAESFGIIAGSAASVGLTIATNLIGGIAGYLESEQDRIKGFFLNMFDIKGAYLKQVAEFADAFSDIFEVFANEDAQKITEDIIAIFLNPLMSIIEISSQLGNDILKILTQPIIDSKEQIKTTLESVLNDFSVFTESVRTILTDDFSMLEELYNQHVAPVFEKITSLLTSLLQEHILPLITTFGEFFAFLGEQLLLLWEEILQPLFQWFMDDILPFITDFGETVIETFLDTVGAIADNVSYLIDDVFTGLINFVKGVFTLDWKKAWQGIASILVGIWNIIATTIETTVNNVIKLINNLIESVNKISSAVGIPSIPKIKSISIPKAKVPFLATGAVIPPNAPFMAMLGDQRNGTNLEAPEDLIRQIVREEAGGSREMLELLMQIAQNTRDTADKDLTIGDREIAKANMRGQLEMGYTLITEG